MLLDPLGSRSPRSLLGWTAAMALLVGIVALGLVHHLAQAVEKSGSRQASLQASLPRGVVDPEVTGSIAGSARSIVLDPCTGRERLLVRGP